MLNKKQLTKLFLEQAGLDTSENSIKQHVMLWWVSPFSPIGLRLTKEGSTFLYSDLKLQNYKYKIKPNTIKSAKLFLRMNKYISCPFYLQTNDTIILYGETDAAMLGLMGGDISQYLENFTRDQ